MLTLVLFIAATDWNDTMSISNGLGLGMEEAGEEENSLRSDLKLKNPAFLLLCCDLAFLFTVLRLKLPG